MIAGEGGKIIERAGVEAVGLGKVQLRIVYWPVPEGQEVDKHAGYEHGGKGAEYGGDHGVALLLQAGIFIEPQVPEDAHDNATLEEVAVGYLGYGVVEYLRSVSELVEELYNGVVE